MNQSLFVHSDIDDMTDLTPNALRVYMHLSRRADKEGRAWPSYQAIGDHCFAAVSDNAATRKTFARKAIGELVAANLLIREERAREDGGQTSNSYVLINPPMPISTPVSIDTPMLNKQPPCLIDTPHAYKASEDTPIEDTPFKKLNEEDTPARDPVHAAWLEIFGDKLPEHLELPVAGLVAECGADATIYGFQASKDANSHNFGFIAKCARNYIPAATNGAGNGYAVELPGVYHMKPPENAPPPAPMPHDDPWSICLAELRRELPGGFVPTLAGSRVEAAGMVNREDGEPVPLYRVVIEASRAVSGLTYFERQCAGSIRRTLSSVLRCPVLIEIVAAEMELSQ